MCLQCRPKEKERERESWRNEVTQIGVPASGRRSVSGGFDALHSLEAVGRGQNFEVGGTVSSSLSYDS